jgi:DNA (cytosine-5)-methyltransferase 1
MKFVDMFAGIGGFHLATSGLPFELEAAGVIEIDKDCRRVYGEYFHVTDDMFVDDVKHVRTEKRANSGTLTLQPFDILFAGFPCQAFSNVGLRQGMQDERGQLFYRILDTLSYYKPKFFVLENVQKLSTIGRGALLKEVVDALERVDYHVHVWDLSAHRYGLPQQRRRLFFCGVSKSIARKPLLLQPPPEVNLKASKYPTVWHLLEKRMPKEHLVPEGTKKVVLRKNLKWQGDLVVNRPVARPLTATMSKWHRANQDNYFTSSHVLADKPGARSPLPPEEVGDEPLRRITPLEGFRLQGFPDRYDEVCDRLNLSLSTRYRIIGNAVPVDLVRSVLKHFVPAYL